MRTVESYLATVPDWATQAEFVVDEPSGQLATLGELTIPSQPQSSFLIAVASVPNDRIPLFLDCQIELTTPQGQSWNPSGIGASDEFRAPDSRLIVIKSPAAGAWKVSTREGMIPYAVAVMAFHPAGAANAPAVVSALAPAIGLQFKCRACKTTAKGLALAIVAAVSYATLPAALIAAVSAFLGGVPTAVAAAFIAAVIGDTADVIAEKLCQTVGLCP